MKKNVVFELTIARFPIQLIKTGKGRYTVVYGVEIHEGLTYTEAAEELGFSIMHALTCEGKLD